LHIHIGRTRTGRAVKITGAKTLTLSNILHIAKNQKGIDIVGVIEPFTRSVGGNRRLSKGRKTFAP